MRRFFFVLCCQLWMVTWTTAGVAAPSAPPVILIMGDSLSAGYGLNVRDGWVSLLEQKLKTQGLPQQVLNASISGETSAGGLTRLPAALDRYKPTFVLIELGGNDGLRAQPLKQLRSNLEKMVELSKAAGATPVLFEMRIPANYGAVYTEGFAKTFADVAQAKKIPLVPFFLLGIASDAANFQDDGIHPNTASQPKMLEAAWPTLAPLLRKH